MIIETPLGPAVITYQEGDSPTWLVEYPKAHIQPTRVCMGAGTLTEEDVKGHAWDIGKALNDLEHAIQVRNESMNEG